MQNIEGVGQKYDIKNVKPGYWRNFLFPKGLAKEATPAFLKQIQAQKQKEEEMRKASEDVLTKAPQELNGKTVTAELRTDEKGNLFAGVAEKKIAKYIKESLNLDIPAELIKLEKPIKQVGSYEIMVKDAIFKLEIKAQSR